jgi:hypothetical protein
MRARSRRASDVTSRDSLITSSRAALVLGAGLSLMSATGGVSGVVHASTIASPADPLPGVETDRTTPADAVPIPRPPAPAESVASGVYFYRIEAGTFRQTQRVVLRR